MAEPVEKAKTPLQLRKREGSIFLGGKFCEATQEQDREKEKATREGEKVDELTPKHQLGFGPHSVDFVVREARAKTTTCDDQTFKDCFKETLWNTKRYFQT